MGPFVEGACTIVIDKVSELLAQDKANNELHSTRSYERMWYATYGPFTAGKYKFDVRVYPRWGCLNIFVCFPENPREFMKCGFIRLLQDHNDNGKWTTNFWTKLNEETAFEFSHEYIKASDLYTRFVGNITSNDLQKHSKDDHMVLKFIVWVLFDDSKVGPPKPVPQSDHKPNQPNNQSPPPDFIGTLLEGQFADINFTVKEQTFTAHRAILAARSSVFRSELLALQDGTCWNKLCVSIQHMDALTFRYLLHFIYTNSLPSDFEEMPQPNKYHLMFIAAHRFKIEGLKAICEEKLTKAVTDSIETFLELIEHQECGILKIVPKDCDIKPEIITTTTSVTKIGDRLYGTSIAD